ncbi:MAG: transcription antitermination factor NusB [Elusimicrobiota bacterium]
MGRRRQARELALQTLYLAETGRMSVSEAMLIVRAGAKLDEKSESFARELAEKTADHRKALDAYIQKIAKNWELGRMAAVDRNLLRMASYELLNCPETPVSVVIDEALEIAKKFSSQDSSKFVNGILDKIKAHRPADGRPPPKARTRIER